MSSVSAATLITVGMLVAPATAHARTAAQDVSRSVTPIATPPVPAEPTSAASVTVSPSTSAGPDRDAVHYEPDAGGPLSGVAYDRHAPPASMSLPVRTLAEAITLAYRTNPQLLSAREQARAADYRVPQARAAYGPSVTAQAGYSFTRTRQEVVPGSFAGAQGATSTAGFIINQPLFTFGRNAAAEAGATATAQYQRDVLRLTEAQVMTDVVSAFVAVRRDATSVTIARENLALLERQLQENELRYQLRDLTQTDLDQTRTRVALGRAQLVEGKGQLGRSQKQFLAVVGAPPGALAPVDLLHVRFPAIEAAYAYAETNSALVRAAQSREKVSRAAVDSARLDRLPRIDLRGRLDYGAVSPYDNRLRTTDLVGEIAISMPLFDSGLRRSRANEAKEANQSDWRLVDQALRDTREAVGTAWDQLAAARASLGSYRAATEAAQRAYAGAIEQQRAGDRSTLDVLDLARDLLTVRNSYNIAVANEHVARAALLAAAGLLEAPQLVVGLDAYDADSHYLHVRHKGDVPLITPALAALDRLARRGTRRDRPSRDAGARAALGEATPLLPAPDSTPQP